MKKELDAAYKLKLKEFKNTPEYYLRPNSLTRNLFDLLLKEDKEISQRFFCKKYHIDQPTASRYLYKLTQCGLLTIRIGALKYYKINYTLLNSIKEKNGETKKFTKST